MVPQVTTGDDPKRTNRRERARFGAAQRVLPIAIADELAFQSAWQVEIPHEHVARMISLPRVSIAWVAIAHLAPIIVAVARIIVVIIELA